MEIGNFRPMLLNNAEDKVIDWKIISGLVVQYREEKVMGSENEGACLG